MTDGERLAEVIYEIMQADAFGDGPAIVASSTSLADAQHYAAVYAQDGPTWIVEVIRRSLGAGNNAQVGREAIARIIDPKAWEFADRHRSNSMMAAEIEYETRPSLAKADAILALTSGAEGEAHDLWPEWATSLLDVMREYTGERYDEVDLPEELRNWWEDNRLDLERVAGKPATLPEPNGGEVERATGAAYHALYGEGMDPHQHAEGWDFAEEIAKAVLAATPSNAGTSLDEVAPRLDDAGVLREALVQIADETKRQQLPITALIHELATGALLAEGAK